MRTDNEETFQQRDIQQLSCPRILYYISQTTKINMTLNMIMTMIKTVFGLYTIGIAGVFGIEE